MLQRKKLSSLFKATKCLVIFPMLSETPLRVPNHTNPLSLILESHHCLFSLHAIKLNEVIAPCGLLCIKYPISRRIYPQIHGFHEFVEDLDVLITC